MPGPLALVGGAEWSEGCVFDRELLDASGTSEVLVLPTAAAYERPERAVVAASRWFEAMGATVRGLMVLRRPDAEDVSAAAAIRESRFIYLGGGSPLHLRSVLKDTKVWSALEEAWQGGATLAGSSAGGMVLGDPMVDPRGGAYTVGLGLVPGLAIFPYHGRAAEHLRERSVDLLARDAVLVGVDEQTALVRTGDAPWEVMGAGSATVYRKGAKPKTVKSGSTIDLAEGPASTSTAR